MLAEWLRLIAITINWRLSWQRLWTLIISHRMPFPIANLVEQRLGWGGHWPRDVSLFVTERGGPVKDVSWKLMILTRWLEAKTFLSPGCASPTWCQSLPRVRSSASMRYLGRRRGNSRDLSSHWKEVLLWWDISHTARFSNLGSFFWVKLIENHPILQTTNEEAPCDLCAAIISGRAPVDEDIVVEHIGNFARQWWSWLVCAGFMLLKESTILSSALCELKNTKLHILLQPPRDKFAHPWCSHWCPSHRCPGRSAQSPGGREASRC